MKDRDPTAQQDPMRYTLRTPREEAPKRSTETPIFLTTILVLGRETLQSSTPYGVSEDRMFDR